MWGLKIFLTYLFEVYEEFSFRKRILIVSSIYKFHSIFYFWSHYVCKSNCVWKITELRNAGNELITLKNKSNILPEKTKKKEKKKKERKKEMK